VPLPINLPKRGLSKDEAAEYCGVSPNTLGRHGPTANKIGDRIIYDRRTFDHRLDELAGLLPGSSGADLPGNTTEEKLLEAIHARQAALRRTSRDRSGGERWYWHRLGHKLTRLPTIGPSASRWRNG
jgi:hypothetical protein